VHRLQWVLIALSSLSLAGSRTLAYDLNIAGIPLIDAAIIVVLTASALLSIHWHRSDRRTRLILIAAVPTVLIAVVESAGQPNEQTLRLLMPFVVFGLALLPSKMDWRRSDLRWLLALPLVIHFTLNLLYLNIKISDPRSTGIDQIRAVIFPDLSRADGLGLIFGFGLLVLADRAIGRNSVRLTSLAGAAYLMLAGQVAFDHKALVLGVAACALAIIGYGFQTRQASLCRFGIAAMSAVVVSFFLAPVLASWQTPESTPATTTPATTTPATTTPATTTPTTTAKPDVLERLAVEGSEVARLDTWGDIMRATDSVSRLITGGNSSNTDLLLNACGFSRADYDVSPRLNKCAVDNGSSDFPLQFAHNWLFTSYLYFGVIGVAALTILLALSLRDSVVVFRSTPMAAAPVVFWLIGLTSVFLWSPFVLTHAAVVTLAINSLARQSSQDRTAA